MASTHPRGQKRWKYSQTFQLIILAKKALAKAGAFQI